MHHLYIELIDTSPLVWRRLTVPPTYTLHRLHMCLQAALGWENSHLYEFSESGAFRNELRYGIPDESDIDYLFRDARKARLTGLLKQESQSCYYLYDFGDGWKHKVTLEKVDDQPATRPLCLAAAGACPPEDVGGIPGYQQMIRTLQGPPKPEQAEYRQWLGMVPNEKWDAGFCSIREVNKRLSLLG